MIVFRYVTTLQDNIIVSHRSDVVKHTPRNANTSAFTVPAVIIFLRDSGSLPRDIIIHPSFHRDGILSYSIVIMLRIIIIIIISITSIMFSSGEISKKRNSYARTADTFSHKTTNFRLQR